MTTKGKPKKAAAPRKRAAVKRETAGVNGHAGANGEGGGDGSWTLRLYVAGQSPKSVTAMTNLRRLCEQHIPGQYNIEVIDLLKNPQLAQMDQILAIPTLVRKLPEPIKRVIGDLSDTERTMIGLDLRKMS